MAMIEGHAGEQAVAAIRSFGTDVMFTLNGGHIWPLYDAARNQGMRVVDTRHEQSATFAAEAYAKLTRRPGCRRSNSDATAPARAVRSTRRQCISPLERRESCNRSSMS